ncbi:MAG: ribonuclease R [Devosiaceae bacterium]|nr:ribonuclease R [Devosiaceae bacterium]
MAKKTSTTTPAQLPGKQQVLKAMEGNPDLKSKRDLTRYFSIKGDLRAPFKKLILQMQDEGLIARKGKSMRRAADLPRVSVLDISPDADPDALTAIPINWEESQGKPPFIAVSVKRGDRTVPGPGERILARVFKDEGIVNSYSARTMKILPKPRRAQIGIVKYDRDGARLIPIERKQKEMRIAPHDLNKAKDGDLVEVEVRSKGRMMIPMAKVVSIVGNPLSEGAVSLIALHNLEIPYRFPDDVLRAADTVRPSAYKGREDWQKMPFITIDPASAKDHDDAVFAEPDTDKSNPGGHIVYVAIADVAAYVTHGSPLDKEAYLRGNSVYFPDRVVPMLPERISNDLCSLKEHQSRPALAVRMVIDQDGIKKSHSFHRVTIKIAAGLSYRQAQAAFEGHPGAEAKELTATVLTPLWNAYQAMAKARDKRAPLDLDLPERKIVLNAKGQVERVFVPERQEANRLIEEMMVAANVCAAQTLDENKTPLIYRVHDQPGTEKLMALKDFLASLQMSFTATGTIKPDQFNQILHKAKETDKSVQVSEMVLRSQAQAEYGPTNYGHFGLNLNQYAHFTSPIRRYADLIVHRALILACNLGTDGLSNVEAQTLQNIAQHISMTERRAMAAERQTTDRLIAHFLSDQIESEFSGKISGVVGAGLFVKLDETGADGFVPASTLGDDYFRHISEKQAMVGQRSGETFALGDAVKVRLLEAAPMAGALRFEITSEGKKGAPLSGSRPSHRTARFNKTGQRGRKGTKRITQKRKKK